MLKETFLVQKVAYIRAVVFEMVSVSFISFEKYELRMRKKLSTLFFISFLPKKQSMKTIFDVIFRLKCSLWNACTIYETMDAAFSLKSEI